MPFSLTLLKIIKKVKKVAYAASFGVDNVNEYSGKQLKNAAENAKEFDAIGVREKSAVHITDEHFGVRSELVADPTLLLDKQVYVDLVGERRSCSSK